MKILITMDWNKFRITKFRPRVAGERSRVKNLTKKERAARNFQKFTLKQA